MSGQTYLAYELAFSGFRSGHAFFLWSMLIARNASSFGAAANGNIPGSRDYLNNTGRASPSGSGGLISKAFTSVLTADSQ